MTARIAAILSLTASGLLAEPATTGSKRSFEDDPFPDKTIPLEVSRESLWSFSIQPYGWLPALDGDVGVRGLPASRIDYDARTLIQNLTWAAFLKAEARYGKWGVLADGFFVDLDADGDLEGNLYRSAAINVQQGLAQLALAYRVVETRQGFIDFYAGARYNYLGITVSADQDSGGIARVGDDTSERISNRLAEATDRLVDRRATELRDQATTAAVAARAAATAQLDDVQRHIQRAIQRGQRADIDRLQALQNQLTDALQSGVSADVARFDDVREAVRADVRRDVGVALVERWAETPREVRRTLERRALDRVFEPVRREFRDLVEARVRQQVATARAATAARLADEVVALGQQRVDAAERLLEKTLKQAGRAERQAARQLVDASRARLAAAEANRADVTRSVDTEALEADVEKAEKKLAKAISKKLEDELPEDASGDVWWVDPFVGFRAQVNLTRWLWLATQCDVGGFGAGSTVAWNLNGSVGVNFTRNLFGELGYRYYYVDYDRSGVVYQVAESGIFVGAGIKF